MRKGIWSAAAVIGLLSVAGALAVAPRAGAAGSTVKMVEGPGDPTKDWKFDPAEITVPAGTTVTWQNSGQQAHTVAADDGSFKSDYISPGGSFQHTFATAGTYAYHCEPHPWMKAVVHVSGGAAPATAASATPTPQAGGASAATSTTATTARTAAAASSSTTTAPAGGAATTTTTAAAAAGTTTTTAVAASTGGAASAAPPTDNSTTTTTAAAAEESAASSRSHRSGKTDTALVVLAGIVTVLLLSLTLRLLTAKS